MNGQWAGMLLEGGRLRNAANASQQFFTGPAKPRLTVCAPERANITCRPPQKWTPLMRWSSVFARSRTKPGLASFWPRLELLEDRMVLSSISVFATGLNNPRGLAFGPNGHLFVAEAGLGGGESTADTCPQIPAPLGPATGGYTGRISQINPAGQRHTLVDGLPSSQTTPMTGSEVLGASAVEFIGHDLYVLIAAGCSKGLEGTSNGVFRVQPNKSLAAVANLSAHNQAVFDGIPDDDHDPEGNPYSMTALGGKLYVTEANHGAVNRVNLDGTVTRLVDVAAQEGHITPTGIAAGPDGNLYVGNIGQFPYLDGTAKVFRITPAGSMTLFSDNLTAVVDLEFDSSGRLYALETFTGNTPAPPFFNSSSGRITRLGDGGWEIAVEGLTNPTAMTFGPDNHLYVSHRGHGFGTAAGQGEILEIDLQAPAPGILLAIAAVRISSSNDDSSPFTVVPEGRLTNRFDSSTVLTVENGSSRDTTIFDDGVSDWSGSRKEKSSRDRFFDNLEVHGLDPLVDLGNQADSLDV